MDPWHLYIHSGDGSCLRNTIFLSTNARKKFCKKSTPPHPSPNNASTITHNPPTQNTSPPFPHTLPLSLSAKYPSPRKKKTLTHSAQNIHLPLISPVRIQRARRFQPTPYQTYKQTTVQIPMTERKGRLPGICSAETHAESMRKVMRNAVGFMLDGWDVV